MWLSGVTRKQDSELNTVATHKLAVWQGVTPGVLVYLSTGRNALTKQPFQ